MGSGYSKKKKQARMFQEQLSQLQNKMQDLEVTGTSGGGLVEVTLNGEHQMQKIRINPECVDPEDIEGLEDLVKAAYENANEQLKKNSPDLGSGGGMPDLSQLGF